MCAFKCFLPYVAKNNGVPYFERAKISSVRFVAIFFSYFIKFFSYFVVFKNNIVASFDTSKFRI